jgi:hypothetical protein
MANRRPTSQDRFPSRRREELLQSPEPEPDAEHDEEFDGEDSQDEYQDYDEEYVPGRFQSALHGVRRWLDGKDSQDEYQDYDDDDEVSVDGDPNDRPAPPSQVSVGYRTGLVIAGAIALAVGVLLFAFLGHAHAVCDSGLGVLAQGVSQNAAQSCKVDDLAFYLGIGAAIVGAVLLFAGILSTRP